eukprot:scaffold912_cov422-Prasinococcus_capsulatus_cf.AAC.1
MARAAAPARLVPLPRFAPIHSTFISAGRQAGRREGRRGTERLEPARLPQQGMVTEEVENDLATVRVL